MSGELSLILDTESYKIIIFPYSLCRPYTAWVQPIFMFNTFALRGFVRNLKMQLDKQVI